MRLKNSVLLFVAAILLSCFASDQEPITAEEILSRSKQAILKLQSASYDFNFHSKSTDKYDTSFIEGKVYLEKQLEDTLMGCYFISTADLTSGTHSSKAATFYNGKNSGASPLPDKALTWTAALEKNSPILLTLKITINFTVFYPSSIKARLIKVY